MQYCFGVTKKPNNSTIHLLNTRNARQSRSHTTTDKNIRNQIRNTQNPKNQRSKIKQDNKELDKNSILIKECTLNSYRKEHIFKLQSKSQSEAWKCGMHCDWQNIFL